MYCSKVPSWRKVRRQVCDLLLSAGVWFCNVGLLKTTVRYMQVGAKFGHLTISLTMGINHMLLEEGEHVLEERGEVLV